MEHTSPFEWRTKARCAIDAPKDRALRKEIFESSDDIFFPTVRHKVANPPHKDYCSICPVAINCLTEGVAYNPAFGVWGGLTRTERQSLPGSYQFQLFLAGLSEGYIVWENVPPHSHLRIRYRLWQEEKKKKERLEKAHKNLFQFEFEKKDSSESA